MPAGEACEARSRWPTPRPPRSRGDHRWRPHAPSIDGGDSQAEHVAEPWTREGRGNVEVATVRVVAGDAAVRNKANTLAARWTEEAAPPEV